MTSQQWSPKLPTSQLQEVHPDITTPAHLFTNTTTEVQLPADVPDLSQILSANDFALAAQKALTPKAWAFYSSAATDLVTVNKNRELIRRVMLRPRILRNVTEVRIDRKILGLDSKAPFIMCPAAMATLAHPDGELGWSRAAANEGIFEIVSHLLRTSKL